MKHRKAAIRQLREDIPGLQITLLRQRTHLVYELKLGDKCAIWLSARLRATLISLPEVLSKMPSACWA